MKKIYSVIISIIFLSFIFLTVYAAVYTLDGTVISKSALRQAVDKASSAQNYRIGARLVVDDKVYRYAKVGTKEGEVLSGYMLVSNVSTVEYNGASDPGIAVISGTASEAGDYYVALLDADLSSGLYQNALITITDVSLDPDQVWSTYVSTNEDTGTSTYGTDTVLVTLVDPLPFTMTTSDYVNITQSPYSNVVVSARTDSSFRMAVGISPVFEADSTDLANKYIWVQTWGLCTGVYTANAGELIAERTLYSTGLGKVRADTVNVNNYQAIGQYLDVATPGTDFTARSPMFLTISP